GIPQLSRSTSTLFCSPGRRIVPCNCGSGRYTNHHTTAATMTTTRATNQDKRRRKDRNRTPIAKTNGQSRGAVTWAQLPRKQCANPWEANDDVRGATEKRTRAGTVTMRIREKITTHDCSAPHWCTRSGSA